MDLLTADLDAIALLDEANVGLNAGLVSRGLTALSEFMLRLFVWIRKRNEKQKTDY